MTPTLEERVEGLCRQRGIYLGHEAPILAALRAVREEALEESCAATCLLCKERDFWLPAKLIGGLWMHERKDDNYIGAFACSAAAIRALMAGEKGEG